MAIRFAPGLGGRSGVVLGLFWSAFSGLPSAHAQILERPVLSEVSAVESPTNAAEPAYEFSATQSGMIAYGGACTSATQKALSGTNRVHFSGLADGTYANCTITVTNASGVNSLPLSVSPFTVDRRGPALTITADQSAIGLGDSALITFTLSEPSSDFTLTDIQVQNGGLSGFSGSGMTYTVRFTPLPPSTAAGDIGAIIVAAGALSDQLGNPNPDTVRFELDLTPTRADRGGALINNYLLRRADQISLSGPDLSGRLDRSGAQFRQAHLSNSDVSFRASLKDLARLPDGDETSAALATAAKTGAFSKFDLWVSGAFSRIEMNEARSTMGLFHGGLDYAVYPELVLGLMGQIDLGEETIDRDASVISGSGWMLGPYFVADLSNDLIWDGRFAYGRSTNRLRQEDGPKDKFETHRWLVSSHVSGGIEWQDLSLRPQLGLVYFEEHQDAFSSADGLDFRDQDITLGRLTFSPNVSHTMQGQGDSLITTHWALEGIWDFERSDFIDLETGLIADADIDLRARTAFGIAVLSKQGVTISADGFLDGIGARDFSAYGGALRLTMPLR
ncbi:MAG: Ig-like domain-containing protein [Hyphomonadaceae bacterium]|nr:Ig-like domain-containing protein [Hyphomonadaceae bacterium]